MGRFPLWLFLIIVFYVFASEGRPLALATADGPAEDVTTLMGSLNGMNALEAYIGSHGQILNLRTLLPYPLSLLG